jgi:hypothetical protein
MKGSVNPHLNPSSGGRMDKVNCGKPQGILEFKKRYLCI